MSIPHLILGVSIIVIVLVDFLMTTISLRAEGVCTRLLSRFVGWLLHATGTRLRNYGGPITLSLLAFFWIFGLWLGWSIFFFGSGEAFAGPDAAPVVGFWDIVGFAGATLSTLGIGVVTPTQAWVHVATVIASIFGMLVLTLSVTYVLNVSSVATRSRSVALQLRDISHVVGEAVDAEARRRDLVSRASDLRATLHQIADSRDSFPLAMLYEVEGSERDVGRRADFLKGQVDPTIALCSDPAERAELQLLANALDRLTE